MKSFKIHSDLLKKCKKGDSKAQFEIYKLYYKGMYNVSLRIVQNTFEAEDIMQDAFLSAFKKLDTWSEEVTFGAWLKKIVVNKSLDYLKKRKLETVNIENTFITNEIETPESEDNLKIKVELIKNSIDELPEKYRIIASMFLFEGYTHSEIGEFLSITSETSRVRFMRAKGMLLKSPELASRINDISFN